MIDGTPVTGSAIIFFQQEVATVQTSLGPINFHISDSSDDGGPECRATGSNGRDFEFRNLDKLNIAFHAQIDLNNGSTAIMVRVAVIGFGAENGYAAALMHTEIPA